MLRASDVARRMYVDRTTVLSWEGLGILHGHSSPTGQHYYNEEEVATLERESIKIPLEDGDVLIKSGEARRILNIAQSTLWNLVMKGAVPVAFVTPTGKYLYRLSDIDDYYEKMYGMRSEEKC